MEGALVPTKKSLALRLAKIRRMLLEDGTLAAPVRHPDAQQLHDWYLFGPKNNRIEHLVRRLAEEKLLSVAEIEALIIHALEERLFGEE